MIDRGAGFISSAAEPLQGRGSGGKGETAEREKLRPSLGHPDKIRLTVADAESYVLML